MFSNDHITRHIEAILNKDGSKEDHLTEISLLAAAHGINNEELSQLFTLVFDLGPPTPLLSTSLKKFVIQHILIPNYETSINADIVYEILSHIGIPQVYYKNGRKLRLKKLPTVLQTLLLEWLICSVHLIENVHITLNSLLSVLFSSLSYEFLRPYLAHLIFLTVLKSPPALKTYFNKQCFHPITNLKRWHIQLVVDLYLKFPIDEYLRTLLILFKALNPNLNYKNYTLRNLNNLGYINPKVFTYPNSEYLDTLRKVRADQDLDIIQSSNEVLKDNLNKYEQFSKTLVKRRKITSLSHLVESTTTAQVMNTSEPHSLQGLLQNINNELKISIHKLFDPHRYLVYTDKFKLYYLAVLVLQKNSHTLKSLDYYFRLSILDDNLSTVELNNLCDKIRDFLVVLGGQAPFPLIAGYILADYSAKPITTTKFSLDNICQRIKLLEFLPSSEQSQIVKRFLEPSLKALETKDSDGALFILLLQAVLSMFSRWGTDFAAQDGVRYPQSYDNDKYITMSKSIALVQRYIAQNSNKVVTHFLAMCLFRFIRSLDLEKVNQYFTDEAILPLPTTLYDLVLEGNPFLASEALGYVAWCKTYEVKIERNKYLQNSYVMDLINFVWKDQALAYEDSMVLSSKAFLLHPGFISKLGKLHILSFSDMFTLNSIGNLFVNPAWSFLTAQIIWKLEDEQDEVNTRHQGPISKESVLRLNSDPESLWLNLDYEDLKVTVLKRLDRMGFVGLGDLLFNSLKTLKDRRQLEVA